MVESGPRFEGTYANLPTPFSDDGNRLDQYRLTQTHGLPDCTVTTMSGRSSSMRSPALFIAYRLESMFRAFAVVSLNAYNAPCLRVRIC
jgi:hypothetical protein